MVEELGATVRRFLEAFNSGQYDICLRMLDSQVEWQPPDDAFDRGVLHGPDEVASHFRSWLGAWEYYRVEPEELIEVGEEVVVVSRETARGRGSGAEVHARRVTGVYTVRHGKVVRLRRFADKATALSAIGFTE